jgi:hypothetical protein
MKPLTNEMLIEFDKKFCYLVGDVAESVIAPPKDIKAFILSALQAKEREMVQEIEKWMNDEIIDGYGRALVIDVEQWKKLKSKLSNLSEK